MKTPKPNLARLSPPEDWKQHAAIVREIERAGMAAREAEIRKRLAHRGFLDANGDIVISYAFERYAASEALKVLLHAAWEGSVEAATTLLKHTLAVPEVPISVTVNQMSLEEARSAYDTAVRERLAREGMSEQTAETIAGVLTKPLALPEGDERADF